MNILAIAPKPPYVQVAQGTFTRANSRFSLVDGTAFFDCGADLSAYAGLDTGSHEYLIKVYDDDDYSIQGYVGAVGGGEALGGELLTGDSSTFTAGVGNWSLWYGDFTINAVDGKGQVVRSGAGGIKNVHSYIPAKSLRKITAKLKSVSDVTTVQFRTGDSFDDGKIFTITSSEVEYSGYYVTGSQIYVVAYPNGTFEMDDVLSEAVTDCAATGFHIISAQGGSTQNWQNVAGDFNYNDAAGYGYKLYRIAI